VPEASGEAFNIGHTGPLSQREFVKALARVARVKPKLEAISREQIYAMGGRLAGGNLYFGEYLDTFALTEVVEKAPRILGIKPIPFEDALREGFAWYNSQPRRPIDYTFEDRLLAGR
jgi:nucleoside-diphosphate-sugar epimerase